MATSRRLTISNARLEAMVEEATVDCYNEEEQATGLFTMIEENLRVPFETGARREGHRYGRGLDRQHPDRRDVLPRRATTGDPDPRPTATDTPTCGRGLDRGLPSLAGLSTARASYKQPGREQIWACVGADLPRPQPSAHAQSLAT